MRYLNLYEIDIILHKLKAMEAHYLYIAAENVKEAFIKAEKRISEDPHGILSCQWQITGKYKALGKVFL